MRSEQLSEGRGDATESAAVAPGDEQHQSGGRSFKRVAAATLIGTLIEGYDFVLYGVAAALVFPQVFFPALGSAAGTIASLATLGVAFVARPIGALLFGHFGDRLGRKRMLVATVLTMGLGTTLMGLLPSAESIGIAAPILLVLLRFVQGLAVGGEWAGSVLFATEHAPADRRGLYSMFPQIGHSLPVGLSAASLLIVSVSIGQEDFINWGWRIPFLASALLLVAGLIIRAGVEETPVFVDEKERGGTVKVPLFDAFQDKPSAILRGAGVPLVAIMFIYVGNSFLAGYGVKQLGIEQANVLAAISIAGVMYAVFTVFSALLSDRIGRKRTIVGAQVLAALWALALFPIIGTGSVAAFYIGLSVTFALAGATYGAVGAYLPEQFPTRYRYTAAGVSYNIGGVLGGGVAPLVAPLVISSAGAPVFGVVLAVLCCVAVACTLSLKENTGNLD
ncbi:MAG: MFS transporter [Rhodococcus sp. (in: high G+C Gram-positive bacteria)]|nr:MAG: MFS transporter [Rhodococcus sp. (in: high G+C Gram-positive bacteria)]